ncbi:MAG: mechanosensitive ion channel family protein [Halanaeroarchaeum sp.]
MDAPPGFSAIDGFGGFETMDLRIGATVAVVIAGLVVIRYGVPWAVTEARRGLGRVFLRGIVAEWQSRIDRVTPWWLSASLVVRILQVAVGAVGVFTVLLVWGQQALAFAFLAALTLSMPVLTQVAVTVGLFVAAWIGVDLLDSWLENITERSEGFTKHQEEITLRLLQITLFIAIGLAVLTLWGVDLGGLLVGAGFLGIVVGMAARQTLGSLLAGFVLMFSRPFEIGDWVEIGEQEGIVTDITIVNTRLENFDGEFVVLPNDVVSNQTIINRSKKGRLRLRVEVGVDYEADPERAQEVAVEALSDVDSLLTVPRPVAVTRRLADSAVVIELRFWIDKPSARRRAKATSEAIRAVKRAFDREDIKIPFPQRELTGREETGGFRVVGSGAPGDD